MQLEGGMAKALKAAAGLTGVAVGLTSTIQQASAKFTTSTDPGNQVSITLARMLGPNLSNKLFQGPLAKFQTNVPQGISPFGPLNPTTFGGIALLIIDYVIHMFIGSKFGYRYARPFIQSIGVGLTG